MAMEGIAKTTKYLELFPEVRKRAQNADALEEEKEPARPVPAKL